MTVRPVPRPDHPVRGDRVRVPNAVGRPTGLVLATDTTEGQVRCRVLLDDHREPCAFWSSDLEIIEPQLSPADLSAYPDTPRTSSVSLAEDPADTLATPCATSATPDTATPDADPAPEAGAASARDVAPAPDLIDLLARVGIKTMPWQRRWIEAKFSSARRAEGPESPRLVTDEAEDGSDVGASLPIVGGRAVPPVPAPADTTNPDGLAAWELELLPTGTHPADGASPTYVAIDELTTGAASVHDDAPVTDLAALRDAAYRLRDVRAEIDALLDVEQTLAARVSEGLGTLVGVPVDLNWGTDRPDALADGAR